LFQKVYITLYNWPKTLSLPGLLFLSEIICKPTDSYNGYDTVVQQILAAISDYNVKLLTEKMSDKFKARVCFIIVHYFKDFSNSKIEAVELIEKVQVLVERILETPLPCEQPEEQEYDSIILPWVSFEECITKEKLDSY
jgi:hypothetical protein